MITAQDRTKLVMHYAPGIHGRNSTYINYSCRCRPCKDAHNLYHREYRKRQKQ